MKAFSLPPARNFGLVLTISLLLLPLATLRAAPAEKPKPEVTLDRPDWKYKIGENAKFRIRIVPEVSVGEKVVVRYRLGREKFVPEIPKRVEVPPEGAEIDGGTLNEPGFLRLSASAQLGGEKITGTATAAFSPEDIRATQKEPEDFDDFWKQSIQELNKIPMDPQLTPRPELSGPAFNAYELSLANFDPEGKTPRFYGILCVPKGDGPFPAVLQTPGAGVRAYKGEIWMPRDKFITLEVGIHGVPVTNPPDFYKQLADGPLRDYQSRNLEDRNTFYFRRVYLGCQRSLEYLMSHPKWDGKNLITRGGSQGGQLAIVSAALNPKVTAVAAAFPAFCDVTGYLNGRAGGWPGFFQGVTDESKKALLQPKIETTGYYDTVNFAKRLKVPGFFASGYNDEVCPPTAFYAMFNSVQSPKEIAIYPSAQHNIPEDGWGRYSVWVIKNSGIP